MWCLCCVVGVFVCLWFVVCLWVVDVCVLLCVWCMCLLCFVGGCVCWLCVCGCCVCVVCVGWVFVCVFVWCV